MELCSFKNKVVKKNIDYSTVISSQQLIPVVLLFLSLYQSTCTDQLFDMLIEVCSLIKYNLRFLRLEFSAEEMDPIH